MNDFPWSGGLVKHGTYYKGFVEDLESHLELHRSIPSQHERSEDLKTDQKNDDNENQVPVSWLHVL